MRRNYLALCWPSEAPEASRLAARLRREASRIPEWRLALSQDGLAIWLNGGSDLPIRICPASGDVAIGEVFPPRRDWLRTKRLTPSAAAKAISQDYWGQFIALIKAPTGERWVYRDPSGMVDALVWSLGSGVVALGSALTDLPAGFGPSRSALDWQTISRFVGSPAAATTDVLVSGVTTIGPGELAACDAAEIKRPIWSPIDFAVPSLASPRELADEIVHSIDACAEALITPHDRVLFELSGGLDSSALAASLFATGRHTKVVQWLNVADGRPEADESRYAQAVADAFDFDLTLAHRRPTGLTEHDLADLGDQTWPAIAGVDAWRDRLEAADVARHRATAIVSGQGGDAIFFHMASSVVVADALAARGLRAIADPLVLQVARRVRTSVWTVLAEARRALRDGASGPKHVNVLLTRDARRAVADYEHAWVEAALRSDLPPGKRFHIRALATNHFNHGCSRRRQSADLLFPLQAQPVMELALSIPTPVLAGGNHARPFQRAALSHRLPPLVLNRRAKGNVSVYLAQMMALSLDVLRPFLLDGRLSDAGLLDREKLDQVMSRDFLLQTAGANDLVSAIATEAWVRRWESWTTASAQSLHS